MDTSTLLVVFLLVTVASLASHALSHWSFLRGARGMGWATTSIGTTMLLAAAAIVVLTFVFRGPLWRPNLGAEQQLQQRAAVASEETSARPLAATAVLSTADASTPGATASQPARPPGNRQEAEADASPFFVGDKQSALKAATTPSTREISPEPSRAFNADEPWAATRCVHVFNPDLSEPMRWKVENGCDVPVGIVLSFCSQSAQECGRNSPVWRYPSPPLIFPAQLQRPISLEEQTVYGHGVRYAACFVATSTATYLIGAPSEERALSSWRDQFEAARVSDGCLSRVQSWTDEGRRTRLPVDLLLGYGNSVP
jgi:hypothetical protein